MFNTSSCMGNRWNPCWNYMPGQWQQSGLLFTQTNVYRKHPSHCGSRSSFPRYYHWISRQCPRCPSFKEHIIICTSRKERYTWLISRTGYSINLNLSDTEKSFNKHPPSAKGHCWKGVWGADRKVEMLTEMFR